MKAAAERILKLEKDEWSEAYQAALRVLLEDRIRTIRTASSSQQRQTLDFVKTFLRGKLEKAIEPQDASLAMSAASGLEYANNHELAAEAYQSFAELIAGARRAFDERAGQSHRIVRIQRELVENVVAL